MTSTTKWTAEGYWNTVLGTGCEDQIAHEHDLTPDRVGGSPDSTLDAWLYRAEAEAWAQGGGEGGDQPAEWAAFHADALARLTEAASKRAA